MNIEFAKCPKCGENILLERQSRFVLRKIGTRGGVIAIVILLVILAAAFVFIRPDVRHRWESNQASCVSALRMLSAAQDFYKYRNGRFATPEELVKAGMCEAWVAGDSSSGRIVKDGYSYKLTLEDDTWTCHAKPIEPGKSGKKSYFLHQGYQVRWLPCENGQEGLPNAGCQSIGW